MQAVTLATFGISELQNLKTSPMQAARCSGVPWANPAEDEARRVARTAVVARAVRNLVMSVSFGFRGVESGGGGAGGVQSLVGETRAGLGPAATCRITGREASVVWNAGL